MDNYPQGDWTHQIQSFKHTEGGLHGKKSSWIETRCFRVLLFESNPPISCYQCYAWVSQQWDQGIRLGLCYSPLLSWPVEALSMANASKTSKSEPLTTTWLFFEPIPLSTAGYAAWEERKGRETRISKTAKSNHTGKKEYDAFHNAEKPVLFDRVQ